MNLAGLSNDMHILFLTDNFPPEGNAPATRTFEHAREWVAEGHKVTVITCAPNFPEGKVYEGFANQWLSKSNLEDIDVWRVKTYMAANEGFAKRIIDYLSFMFASFFFGCFTRRVDVVVGTSPQFFTVVSAWALAKLKRVPFVFELRDLWPASITAVGAVESSFLIPLMEKFELFLYRQANLIISVTQSFKTELLRRGVQPDRIKVVLNGVDLQSFHPAKEKDLALSEEYGLQGKFVIGYIGTHGLAHALENVIEAARLIAHADEIRIILAGGGAERARLERIVAQHHVHNLIMIPRQPKTQMHRVWSLCDVSLVHLKDSPLFRGVIPSKIFESMGMGLPVIMSVPIGEATRIVEKAQAGVIVHPEDPNSLSQAFLKLAKSDVLIREMSARSKNAASNYDRKELARDMLRHLEELVP